MNMISDLKKKKRWAKNCIALWKEYYSDYKEYKCWQYHNPNLKSQSAFEAKITRQAHILEKGMSLPTPREKFGIQKALELLDFIKEYEKCGYSIKDNTAVLNALGILNSYLIYHEEHGFKPEEIINEFRKYSQYIPTDKEYGIAEIDKITLQKKANGLFPEFFLSRHSVRQFSDKPINEEDIQNAVELAMKAPSACNRQSCKVYFYKNKTINFEIGRLIAGNTGFEDEVQNYLVVTSNISAFYDPFERNQMYVDGGIFAMALVEALHYYGIANCVLQNGETKEKDIKFRTICKNIPRNEKIILFIAIGYYKDSFTYALSNRKTLNDVLIIEE